MKYRIKEERDARGWTQSELARRAHATQQAIQRYESGEREPKVSAVINIAAALGVTLSYLLGLDEDENVLSPNEQHLIGLYRSANEQGKSAIMAIAENQAGDVARRAAPPGIESTA